MLQPLNQVRLCSDQSIKWFSPERETFDRPRFGIGLLICASTGQTVHHFVTQSTPLCMPLFPIAIAIEYYSMIDGL